jgi:hypothetical protein
MSTEKSTINFATPKKAGVAAKVERKIVRTLPSTPGAIQHVISTDGDNLAVIILNQLDGAVQTTKGDGDIFTVSVDCLRGRAVTMNRSDVPDAIWDVLPLYVTAKEDGA